MDFANTYQDTNGHKTPMLILRLIYRHISRRKLQSILFVVGVALGVAIGVAIDLANASANRAFSLSTEGIAGRTTHQIVSGSRGVDFDVYRRIREETGIQEAAPVIVDYVRAVNLGDQPLHMLGVEFSAENPFREYLGRINQDAVQIDASAFLVVRNAVLISQTLANRFDLDTGDTITLRINTELVETQIVGLLQPNDTFTEQALDDLILVPLETAQRLLNMENHVTRIDLILPENYDMARIEDILPPGVTITTPEQRSDVLNQMTEAFEINLQALSLLALVVGVFLIYNTVMFSVVQRRGVIGILRSLGTSKRQIFLIVVGEAFFLGAIGTFSGLLLGVLMGRGTVGAVSQTVSDLYFRVNVRGVTLTPDALLRGAVIGLLVSVLAALIPAIDATRTTPAGSMRRSELEQNTRQLIPYFMATGIVLITGGILLLQLPTQGIIISFTALFMVVIGAAMFTPPCMIAFMWLVTPLSGLIFGVLGRMAPRAVVRSISRTSVAVAALTLAVSVIVGVGVMISSFRETVENWLNITLGADIFISAPGMGIDLAPDVDPAIIEQIQQVDGVARVPVVRNVDVIAPDYPDLPPVNIAAVDTDLSHGERQFSWKNIPDGKSFWDLMLGGQVMVSEPFAFKHDISPEKDTITLLTDRGEQEFKIFGVFYDYASDRGVMFMNLDVYRRFYDDPYITSLAVQLEPGANLHEVIDTLRTKTLVGQELEVQSNRELREGAMEVFDRTFSITAALQVLAIIVAFIGILSSLMALQLEHVREYGIMRANGMTPGQLRIFTLIQTGLMGVISGLMALPIGLALAFILVYVINVRSFGWSMNIILPPMEFIQAFLVALVASLLAGLYPAWRVSRIQAAEALRRE